MVRSKNKRNWILFLLLVTICMFISYQYIYQNHRDIKKEKAHYSTTPQTISDEFKQNPIEYEKKYLNKTIEISGITTETNYKDLTLNNTVFCQFTEIHSVKINSIIKIKGRCIGYDDLFEQVKLDQCSIIK